jgi:hypothetical protein
MQAHDDGVAVARHRFVDAVVDDLVDEVMESTLRRVPDIHTGALSNGLESLKDGDVLGVVTRWAVGVRRGV